MKTNGKSWWLALVICAVSLTGRSQDNRTEVPGDHFSLEGALELFKRSTSPEDFERLLNLQDSKVNNLDLNGDGDIDYIRVIDRHDGNIHTFTMQAVISDTESQDVAVIELEKLANGKAVLQITGDADVYGTETIIEPTSEVRVNAGTSTSSSVVNVWTWPSVQYVYGPYYAPWTSPWSWGMWPMWWHPWRPVGYYVYRPWWDTYRPYYSVCYTHRIYYAPSIYRPYRSTSMIVYNRHHDQIDRYRAAWNGHRGDSYGQSGSNNGDQRRHDGTTQNWRRSSWNSDHNNSGDHNPSEHGGRQGGQNQNKSWSNESDNQWRNSSNLEKKSNSNLQRHSSRGDNNKAYQGGNDIRIQRQVPGNSGSGQQRHLSNGNAREGRSGGQQLHIQHAAPGQSGSSGNHNFQRSGNGGGGSRLSGGGAHRKGRE